MGEKYAPGLTVRKSGIIALIPYSRPERPLMLAANFRAETADLRSAGRRLSVLFSLPTQTIFQMVALRADDPVRLVPSVKRLTTATNAKLDGCLLDLGWLNPADVQMVAADQPHLRLLITLPETDLVTESAADLADRIAEYRPAVSDVVVPLHGGCNARGEFRLEQAIATTAEMLIGLADRLPDIGLVLAGGWSEFNVPKLAGLGRHLPGLSLITGNRLQDRRGRLIVEAASRFYQFAVGLFGSR